MRIDKGTPVAAIPRYTIPLHNHLNDDDGTANSKCQVVGPSDQLPDSRSLSPLLVRSSGVLSETIAFLSRPVPGLRFMPIPTLVIIYSTVGGKLASVYMVCGDGERVNRDEESPRGKGVQQGSMGRGTRRGGTASRKARRTLSGDAKREIRVWIFDVT